ncbi:putative leucine-rich repeat-containing protein DDB_G0290503 [Pseudorasbora parva]|uniref:putative leucine-rich repeat-containing protein DDB_G0290503 n=1 Tax=Pseudorasbora parva TaxID=51549 RepID=UPI00351F65CF
MQTNSQQSGQLQNLHGKGTTSGDGTSNTLDQNFYQLCLPSQAASPSYSGQGATGNYLTQITCTIQPAITDQILTSSNQATKNTMLAQENPLTSKYTLPTGKQNSQMIMWNIPPNNQIFLPINNINLQGGPNNNGPNMPRAFNSNNSFYMQQQNTSLAAGANNSRQSKAKTMDTKSLNESRRSLNTIDLHSRQQHANSPTILPKKLQRTSLPSDLNYYPPTENAPHGHSCLFGGYNYQSLIPGKSIHANVQTPSTCVQNIAAQRAVAVVTPLSPIGTSSVNVLLDKSAHMKVNERTVQEIVLHQQNIPHGLEAEANLKNHKGETNVPTSMHQRPKSVEPRLNEGLCNVGAKSPVCITDSTGQSRSTSLPKSVVAEQKKSVPTQMQNKPSEKIKNNCTITDKKTVETETIPVIEWPLERLHTLMAMVQQIENVHQKNVQKTDAGRDILKLYWNGDFQKFYNAVQTGIYQNIMEEVYVYGPMREPVILRQIKSDARNKVIKDFHVLKHNEEPPKMTYKSSWLNLNENVDDIDKECGYSWFYYSFENAPDHEAQISKCKTQSNSQEATEKPSTKWLPKEVENKAAAEEPTSDNKSLHKNLPVLFKGQSPPVTDADCSPKRDCVVTVQTNNQPNITNSLEDMITVVKDLDKRDVQSRMSSSDDQFCNNVRPKHVLSPKSTSQSDCTNSPKPNVVAEQWGNALSQIQIGSSVKMPNKDCASLDKRGLASHIPKTNQQLTLCMNEVETDKVDASASEMNVLPHEMAETSEMMEHNVIAASSDKHEPSLINTAQVLDKISMEERANRERLEKDKKSASTILSKQSLAENNGSTEMTNKVQAVTDNCSLKLNVVEKQRSFQPNIINPLNGMTNLVRTLKERDYLLKNHPNFEKRNRLKRKRQHSSETLRLNNSYCNGVGAKSPALTNESSSQSDCTSPLMLSPVVGKQPEFVSVTQVQNKSIDCDNGARYELDPKPSQELSVQMNEEEIVELDTSTSIRINVLPPEVAKQCFAGQLMDNEDMTATRELIFRASLLQTSQEHDMLLTKVQMERLEEADGNPSLKGYLVEEQTECQSNAVKSLKAMADLVRGVGEKRQIGKCYTLKNKHQPSTATSRLDDRSCSGATHLSLTRSASQIDCVGPPILHPVITEPYQMQFNEEMPEIDCVLPDASVRCETDSKPSQELPVQMNEEEVVEMDTSIRINVLSHEVAKQCFAGQLMEDQDIAAQPEMVHKTSLLYTPQDTISKKEPIDMWRLEEANSNCSSNGNLVAEQTNCQSILVQELKSMTNPLRPVGEQHLTEKCENPANANSRLDDSFCNKAKCLVLKTESTCQIDLTSPNKLLVIAEPSQKQNEFNEDMPDIDCIVTDDSMRYETDPKLGQELDLNTNEEETDKTDALDSIKINVLPHDMAELWFSGEMEVKDLQEDIDVHITTEDQVKVQVLELVSEKELHLEDVKLKEGKYQSSGDEKLESFCCLAKWFQTLDYGNSSSCMCQKKADQIKTEVHGTSLELQTEKEEPNELVELENSSLEGTEDSEITEDSETEDEAHLPKDPIEDKTHILKDILSSEEVCEMETEISEHTRDDSPSSEEVSKMETETSEHTRADSPSSEEVSKMETEISEKTRDDSPSKCATNVTMMNKIEQDTSTPDLKRKTNTICLALYGSSSGRKELKLTKRSKWKEFCEEPPETLQLTVLSHQKIKGKSMSKNRKGVESQDDVVDKRARIRRAPFNDLTLHGTLPSHSIPELSKNALSSTSIKKLLSTSANAKSTYLGEGNKQKRRQKRQHKYSTRQMSMNKYVIRGRTAPSKLLHSPEKVTKSKYELGNPALMPLEEGLALEFKVLPESFNFEDGAELNCAQADMSQSAPNGTSGPEDKLKQRETNHSPTQGVWSFSPLKKKHAQPIQVTDVSGSCSLFQEFKKRYHKKKDITSKQNSSQKV